MEPLKAIIMAAGKGTRMKSAQPKVLHELCGRPMLSYVIDAAREAGAEDIALVINRDMAAVEDQYGDEVEFVYQDQQLGTGHAVMMALDFIAGHRGPVLVLCGDTPLLTGDLLRELTETHMGSGAAATVLSTVLADPAGYGRVIRAEDGSLEAIVEERDADPVIKNIAEVNTGSYCFAAPELVAALPGLQPDNAQQEFYLTDIIALMADGGQIVQAHRAARSELTQGINDRRQLAQAEGLMLERIRKAHLLAGVSMPDPASTYIDAQVTIGADTVIQPFTVLRGATDIGSNCHIGPFADITDSTVGDGSRVRQAVLDGVRVGPSSDVGPFTYLRPGTILEEQTKAGTFVEMKKAHVGPGSKVPHLAYIGDANLGRGVNIGAGTITCNYDGIKKSVTDIEDEAFVGTNTSLIAPVVVGRGAYTAAGSTIYQDVPADALGIGRAEQKNIEGWAERRRQKARLRNGQE